MHVANTAASGRIGAALAPPLPASGHQATPFVRREAGDGEISGDPTAGRLAAEPSVVALAAATVAR